MAEIFAKTVELAVDVAETPDDAQVQIQISKQKADRGWYLSIAIPGAGTDGRALEDCGLTQQEQDALKAACLKMQNFVMERAGYTRKAKVVEPIKEGELGGEVKP